MKHRFPAIYFEATRLCNLSCPICMTSSNDDECVRESRGRELSYEEIRDLVLIPAKRLGTVAVGWSGGEFLLRQDAFDLLRLTAELEYRCNVCSNCEILDRELLQEMKEAAVQLIRDLDMRNNPNTQVGVVQFNSIAKTLSQLTNNEGRAVGAKFLFTVPFSKSSVAAPGE